MGWWCFLEMFKVSKKDFQFLFQEKTILIIILIQLFIASSSSILIFGLSGMYDPSSISSEITFGTVNGGPMNDIILKESESNYATYDNLEEALRDFERGKIDAVIQRAVETKSDGSLRVYLKVFTPKTGFVSTLVTSEIKELALQYENQLRAQFYDQGILNNRVKMMRTPKTSSYFHFTHSILVPLLYLVPALLSGILIVDLITEEYENGTMNLLEVSPLDFETILNGKVFVAWILVPIQATLWMTLLRLNGVMIGNVFSSLILTISISGILITAGGVISLRFKDRKRSQLVFTTFTILFLGLLHLSPFNPINLLAKLSTGSETTFTYIFVLIYSLASIGFYGFFIMGNKLFR